MKYVKSFILLLFLAIILIFSVQNAQAVDFSFLNYSATLPLALATISVYVLGALSGGIVWSLLKKITSDEKPREPRQRP